MKECLGRCTVLRNLHRHAGSEHTQRKGERKGVRSRQVEVKKEKELVERLITDTCVQNFKRSRPMFEAQRGRLQPIYTALNCRNTLQRSGTNYMVPYKHSSDHYSESQKIRAQTVSVYCFSVAGCVPPSDFKPQ